MTFTAGARNVSFGKVSYYWSITAGMIVSGQGTATIKIQTTEEMAGMNVTAAVKVPGVAAGCADTASEIAGIEPISPICNLDEFGKLTRGGVKARMDNFLIHLQNNPEAEGFIVVHLNEKETRAFQRMYLNSMYDAIVWLKKDPSRVTFAVLVDKYETNTTLYIVPPGTDTPGTDEASILIKGEEFKQKIKTLFSKTN